MALRKIVQVEGDTFLNSPSGIINLGKSIISYVAYCKITKCTITNLDSPEENGTFNVECVGVGDNSGYRSEKQYAVKLSISEDAPNVIKQSYIFLKTLPDWSDCIDC